MIRVGFFLSSCFPDEYPGGKNYMKNLFYSLNLVENNFFECILFIGNKTSLTYEKDFVKYAKIVRSSLFDRWSLYWFFYKLIFKFFNSHIVLYPLIKKYNIAALSHSDIYGKNLPFKTINWLPDIQHVHLPHLLTEEGFDFENKRFKKRLKLSDLVIFSSYTTQKDGLCLLPNCKKNNVVIRPAYNVIEYNFSDFQKNKIEKLFNFSGKYFYLPNQFWVHKNHKIVFEAVKKLRGDGLEPLVICTGLMEGADAPNRNFDKYISELRNYYKENNLSNNIKLLGLVDYKYVQYFMRNCISAINPSFFEGWSSTVEESKSIGKKIILSDLEIHREQDPPGAIFFDPHNAEELAKIMAEIWKTKDGGPDLEKEKDAKVKLEGRIKKFGEEYQDSIENLFN